MAKKIVCKYSTDDYVLADTNHCVPIKPMAVTGNSRDFTIRATLQKNQIQIIRHSLSATLEIIWYSVLLKLGNTEVTLPTLVTVHPMEKY